MQRHDPGNRLNQLPPERGFLRKQAMHLVDAFISALDRNDYHSARWAMAEIGKLLLMQFSGRTTDYIDPKIREPIKVLFERPSPCGGGATFELPAVLYHQHGMEVPLDDALFSFTGTRVGGSHIIAVDDQRRYHEIFFLRDTADRYDFSGDLVGYQLHDAPVHQSPIGRSSYRGEKEVLPVLFLGQSWDFLPESPTIIRAYIIDRTGASNFPDDLPRCEDIGLWHLPLTRYETYLNIGLSSRGVS